MLIERRIDRVLLRTGIVALIALVGMSCYLLWRLSMVVYRIEQSVVTLSQDVQKVTHTAADLAERVDKVTAQVDQLSAKFGRAMPINEANSLLDHLAAMRERTQAPGALDERGEDEIEDFLESVLFADPDFICDGERHGGLWMSTHLGARYVAFKGSLRSAEDFIEQIATRSMTGKPYMVAEKPPRTLPDWLRERLAKYRADYPAESGRP